MKKIVTEDKAHCPVLDCFEERMFVIFVYEESEIDVAYSNIRRMVTNRL